MKTLVLLTQLSQPAWGPMMICILTLHDGQVVDWLMATDTHDARRQAQSAGDMRLASALYQIEFPTPGKHTLPTGQIMLVQ